MDERVKIIYELLKESCTAVSKLCEDDFDACFVKPLRENNSLSFSISSDTGASKGVILIEGASEVIKIPFHGYYDNRNYSYDRREASKNDKPEPNYEDYFYEFEYAGVSGIEDPNHWDYCNLECNIYERAVEEGFAEYFAAEYRVGKVHDHPIYAQQKARIYCDREDSSRHSKERLKSTSQRCSELNIDCFNNVWISDFIDAYGESELIRLIQFVDKYDIGDLHDGNIGYIDEMPVLVDYSNYRE